jgi:hypothetical protein
MAVNSVAQVTGEAPRETPPIKNSAAVELGRRGGLRAGKARMYYPKFLMLTLDYA